MKQEFMNKELRRRVKELNSENKIAFDKIKNRLAGSIIQSPLYKENISEVLNMLVEGQKRNESYKEIVGEDLDGFCEEIIENSYKPNIFYKVFRISYIFSVAIGINIIFKIIFPFDENIILKSIAGELSEVNIASYTIWFITSIIYFLSQDLATRTSLKKTSIKSFYLGLLIIAVYLQTSLQDRIELRYMINISYPLLTVIVLLIILFYQIYIRRIINKFRIN